MSNRDNTATLDYHEATKHSKLTARAPPRQAPDPQRMLSA